MMIFNFFNQLADITGLPPMALICALVIIFSLTLVAILVLIKVRNIRKALNNLNYKLDAIGERIGWRSPSEAFEIEPSYGFKFGSHLNNEAIADDPAGVESQNSVNGEHENGPEKQLINTEISTKIHELLKKSGKPTPYHELTKHLSKDYPGYDYDFFLKEIEDLQKEGKVEVQLIAGKLYFQIKNT